MKEPTVPRAASAESPVAAASHHAVVRRPRSIERWQTNVPNHAGVTATLPPAARHVVVSFGGLGARFGGAQAARHAADRLAASAPSSSERIHVDDLDPRALARIARLTSDAVVGTAFAFVGAEREVFAARSTALASGAISQEVVLVAIDRESAADDDVVWADGAEPRNLFCAHCHRIFAAVADVGDVVTCPGCGLSLSVHYNFSRRRAAYLAKHVATDSLANRGSRP